MRKHSAPRKRRLNDLNDRARTCCTSPKRQRGPRWRFGLVCCRITHADLARILAIILLMAGLGWTAGRAVAAPPDAVEALRELLRAPALDPGQRDRCLREQIRRLNGVSDLRRAVALRDWRDEDPDEKVAAVDQANRAGSFFGIGIPSLEAIAGLTFGRMQGMFVHSPFLLLGVPAAVVAARTRCFQESPAMLASTYDLFAASVDPVGDGTIGDEEKVLIPAIV